MHFFRTRPQVLSAVFLAFLMCFVLVSAQESDAATVYKSKTAFEKRVQSAVENHDTSLTVYAGFFMKPSNLLYDLASERNGVKLKEKQYGRGDYYSYSYLRGIRTKVYVMTSGGRDTYKYVFKISYVGESKAQTRYINKKCKSVAKTVKGKSQKKKAKAIALWVAKNMRYQVTNEYSIYKPLVYKRGQCHHYARLYYKIAKDAGLNVRIIRGTAKESLYGGSGPHVWCIVKIGKKWYNVDPTWADGGSKLNSRWVLKGSTNVLWNFTHTPYPQYRTSAYRKAHPMSRTDK